MYSSRERIMIVIFYLFIYWFFFEEIVIPVGKIYGIDYETKYSRVAK